jgi:hypothetical protein
MAAYSQTAAISDTLYGAPGGALWTGRIVVALNSPATAQPLYSGSTSLAGFSITLCVGTTGTDCTTTTAAGVVTATLYTNSAITPAGTSYGARFAPTRGAGWAETWVVGGGHTTLLQIRSTTVPTPTVMIALSQISGYYTASAVIDAGSTPDGTCKLDATAVTVTNAALGGKPTLGASYQPPEGVKIEAKVTGPNSMKLEICNHSGAAYDPASATYYFGVTQ